MAAHPLQDMVPGKVAGAAWAVVACSALNQIDPTRVPGPLRGVTRLVVQPAQDLVPTVLAAIDGPPQPGQAAHVGGGGAVARRWISSGTVASCVSPPLAPL